MTSFMSECSGEYETLSLAGGDGRFPTVGTGAPAPSSSPVSTVTGEMSLSGFFIYVLFGTSSDKVQKSSFLSVFFAISEALLPCVSVSYNYITEKKDCQSPARFFVIFSKKSCYFGGSCGIMVCVKISIITEGNDYYGRIQKSARK